MIESQIIPITKLISAGCRDFMAFRGPHSFEFKDGINYIIGRNGEGKTSLVRLIIQALNPNVSKDYESLPVPRRRQQMDESSLIELKFIADNKMHHIRRVLLGGSTSDIHLYIGEGEETQFLRDDQALNYLIKLKPVSTLFDFNGNKYSTSNSDVFYYTYMSFSDASLDNNCIGDLNEILDASNQGFSISYDAVGEFIVTFENGEVDSLGNLGGSTYNTIFIVATLLNAVNKIGELNRSEVIVIDGLDHNMDSKGKAAIDASFELLSTWTQIQFILTARFKRHKKNIIRVNGPPIPKAYAVDNHKINHGKFYQKWLKTVKMSMNKWGKNTIIINTSHKHKSSYFKSKW